MSAGITGEMFGADIERAFRATGVEEGVGTATPPPAPRGSRIAWSRSVVSCVRADGSVLVDVGRGQFVPLDPFGSRVWRQLADQPTLPELVLRLREEGSSAERLAEDVARLLARWGEMGVIAWR